MEEIEIIDKLMKAHGRSQETLGFGDYVEIYKRMGRTIRYYLDERNKADQKEEEKGGNEDA